MATSDWFDNFGGRKKVVKPPGLSGDWKPVAQYYLDEFRGNLRVNDVALARYGFEPIFMTWEDATGLLPAAESSSAHTYRMSKRLADRINKENAPVEYRDFPAMSGA